MKIPDIKNYYKKDTSFAQLMTHRIYNVLLYASKYDVFGLEEDGRIDEQIFNEYTELNLRYPPRFTLVSRIEEANKELSEHHYDLIISMPSGDSINPFEWAKEVKKEYPDIPIVVLTPFSKSVSKRIENEDLSAIDYVFSWLGNSEILLAIIKLIEDKMNVEEDVNSVGVQVILFVEDSVRFYSSIIPRLYKFVFTQSRSFMTEALNEHEQMLRMRGRPKILLARNYEEATGIYKKYKHNMLGVITDASYKKNGVKIDRAGIELCREIRNNDDFIPLIVESSDDSNHSYADKVKAAFLNKNSKTFVYDLRKIITNNFGFGDFVFIHPLTKEVEARIHNLRGLQSIIFEISDDCLAYHVSRNNISRWLYSRAMFPLAEFLKDVHHETYSTEELGLGRKIIYDAIDYYRKKRHSGIVATFHRDRFDQYSNFTRIGAGSLGGKGRGLAFVDAMITRNDLFEKFTRTQVKIPKTVVICTDVFSEFIEKNNLYGIALSDKSDEEILNHFLNAKLPQSLRADLYAFITVVDKPIAIRSSSLLEDSHYQPFAGIYSTYMIPSIEGNKKQMLELILKAIKAVYASVYFRSSKSYMMATHNLIDEEKMAIVLQEICGSQYENRYYPSFSGVARSLNYYPLGAEKSEEGVANIAMGLGKYIVDGGQSLRFSPGHPNNVLQTSTVDLAMKETQTYFNALDMHRIDFSPQLDDGFNLLKINVQDAMKDGTLKYIASTYVLADETIYDGLYDGGRKVITFANILQHNTFPLAEILKNILVTAQAEMGRPIEIEFAVNLDYSNNKQHAFYLLQIRPIVDNKDVITEDIEAVGEQATIIKSKNALGHGIVNDVCDIVYVKPESFNASKTELIKDEIDAVNKRLQAEDRHYILVGPGRWGSSDPWLGVPVKWQHISNAKTIIESGLSHYRIDPSQGTHFFQNLTSLGVSYFTINPFNNDGTYDVDFLNKQQAVHETEFIRHVRFESPIVVKIDSRKSLGIILKPEKTKPSQPE
ncbi:MAG: phosphoenolpyruvate synthase [Prevotellaceae bacterium]|jgi:DNA-binding response OmpR family regulator|nr:phosphoenolpyruvate synthase [Prevotellaceae bacterium]